MNHTIEAILAHKKSLAKAQCKYDQFTEVLIVLQFFNKEQQAEVVLRPFVEYGCQNIILFADGCIDQTATVSHKRLEGINHFVVNANDRHEISNYRLAVAMAKSLRCRYCLLLQDDDVYGDDILAWLAGSLQIMSKGDVAIVGGNGGEMIANGFQYRDADTGLKNSEFCGQRGEGGELIFGLKGYHMFASSNIVASSNASNYQAVACVNRAPQLISVEKAEELSFFPRELEPYQYDDYYNCFESILNGYKFIHAPFNSKYTDASIGGMRVFNGVTTKSRPDHFSSNWSFIYRRFGKELNDGTLARVVKASTQDHLTIF